MDTSVNTSLQGQYTLYDENMNVLCETDNLITDWGMRRFVGDRSTGAPHPQSRDLSQVAFVYNMRYITLGYGSAGYGTESYTDFKLASGIPVTEYVETNEASTTGTTYSTEPVSGDLLITFTRLTRFKMASAFNATTAPLSTYSINEIGCSWTTLSSLSANNRYGIFSRATLPNPVIVRPNSTIFAKYRLTVRTDANQVKSSMQRRNGTGAVTLPANKTNVRDLPLYPLKSDGSPLCTLNFGSANGYDESGNAWMQWDNYGPNGLLNGGNPNVNVFYPFNGQYQRSFEYSPPLLEDAGSFNAVYVGNGDVYYLNPNSPNDTFGTRSRRLWWLQCYTSDWAVTGALSATQGGANPSRRYDTFTSTTTAMSGIAPYSSYAVTYNGMAGIAVQNQEGWGMYNTATDGNNLAKINKRWEYNYATTVDVMAYDQVMFQQTRLFDTGYWSVRRGGRKPAESEVLSYDGAKTWTRTIRFLFTPTELPPKTTVFNLYRATLGNWHRVEYNPGNRSTVYVDTAAAHTFGVVTALSAEYTPNPALYDGFEYNFTYSRA